MKHRIIASIMIVTLTLGLSQGAFALQKKTLSKDEIAKQQKQASSKTSSAFDAAAAMTLEAQPKKNNAINKKTPVRTITKKIKKTIDIEAEKRAREAALNLVQIGEQKIPKELYDLYSGETMSNTVSEATKALNSLITDGKKFTDSQVEEKLRGIFSNATKDTENFAAELTKKYALQGLVNIAIQNPKNIKNVQKIVEQEMRDYAKKEVNKLANEVVAAFVPELAGLAINFTDLNKKNLKASLRGMAVDALAQSYLGPQYVILYVTFEMLFPKQAAQVHAELRRFDKNYIQPLTDNIQDGINSAVTKIAAEANRTAKRIDKEIQRSAKKVSKEAKRLKKRLKF